MGAKENREEKLSTIDEIVQKKIDSLTLQSNSNYDTEYQRLEACKAKTISDILDRELANFNFEAIEKKNEDPLTLFRKTID